MKNVKVTRLSFLIKSAGLLGGIILAGIPGFFTKYFRAFGQSVSPKLAVVTTGKISKEAIEKMLDSAFAEFGGINALIKKGMNVVIKPNIAWNSAPEKAHNTNPDLVEGVVKRCVKAGAKVTVFDRTCNAARPCYKNSGIEDAANKAGAIVEQIDDRKFVTVKVPNGLRQGELSVYKPILDADFVINMPIAKHHGSADLTISMKNLMGVIGGSRGMLHLGLHENIVDFAKTVKVDLIICDALRILTRNGPNGGSPADI
ncbi:MAG: DUF362 domain-containing protein, partial [Spirochaetes bacterium]|nr:DUF362 domain-containing protein [Spirochaetota bacterium]